jgi:ribosomal-protein-alanine N-acetyltransferase
MRAWLARLFRPAVPVIEPARPRDAAQLADLHRASFHRGWGETEFAQMLAERGTLIDRLRLGSRLIGFAASRIAADEAELLSIAIDTRQRGRGLSRALLQDHLGHLAARGVRTVFLEVESGNTPAERLYRAAGFRQIGKRPSYYRQPSGESKDALVLRRDLF